MSINGQNSQLALNDNVKLTYININPKFKWIKCSNQRHRQANWIKKSKPISSLYPDPSHKQGHTKTQNKGLVEDLQIKWREKTKQTNKQKPGGVTFIFDKIDLNSTKTKRNKEEHYIMVKRINATIGVNNHKYICTQYRNTRIHKTSS